MGRRLDGGVVCRVPGSGKTVPLGNCGFIDLSTCNLEYSSFPVVGFVGIVAVLHMHGEEGGGAATHFLWQQAFL